VVLDLVVDDHPDCVVGIGWETGTSDVTFGELGSASIAKLGRASRTRTVMRS
jgi:hypothetical protein